MKNILCMVMCHLIALELEREISVKFMLVALCIVEDIEIKKLINILNRNQCKD